MNKFVFALHRGGSSILGSITKGCAQKCGQQSIVLGNSEDTFAETGPDGAAERLDRPPVPGEAYKPQLRNWSKRSGVFSPIRRADFFPDAFFHPGDIGCLNMRDPRDCMVSGYFGFLRLHNVGLKAEGSRRQYERGIDRYVLEAMLPHYKKTVNDYIILLEAVPAIHILSYEEMVTDFPSWFAKFYKIMRFSPEHYEWLEARHSKHFAVPGEEDIDAHKRQMLPGDYLRKLKPETIAKVNEELGGELAYFGYDIS